VDTPIEIRVHLTKQDIARARLAVYFRSGIGVAITVAGVFFSVLNLFLAAQPEVEAMSRIPPWFPAFLALLVIPCAVAFGGINSQAIRAMLVPLRYEFSDEGFLVESPTVTARFGWNQVARAYESRHAFVLTTPGTLQVLPKRFFSLIDEQRFARLLRTTLGPRARTR
jgi:YcxB-like protein